VRAHRVYGYSPVQQVLMTVNIALRRQLWQLDYFTEGSIPDATRRRLLSAMVLPLSVIVVVFFWWR
jgi:hypothetical protein